MMGSNRYFEVEAEVVSYKVESEGIVSCLLESEKIVSGFRPGQFITVQVNAERTSVPVLRRPFAISSVVGDRFEIIFHIVGRGTDLLYRKIKEGNTLSIMGPLGNGFDISDTSKKKLLIAGGIGIAPIKSLYEYYLKNNMPVTLLWGNRNGSGFFGTDCFKPENSNFINCTDDGSVGFKGNVVEMLKNLLSSGSIGTLEDYDIFAVGPDPMMRAVSSYLENMNLSCQVSLETPMACGMGVCQGCAVSKKDGSGYLLVCKDGPVFRSDKIII
ncbi:MAG: dihydroorotate dehydrogenase electron transfer subunit [Candidatus Delongbacteria bacterium]|nr:dihydroorotate dehydrogenase electron transfer subunit [Candidatus Delongbacteria bacterium]